MPAPKIDARRPEYEKTLPKWELIRDCLDGQKCIKEKGDKYLPRPNASDTSQENRDRFAEYVERAVFYNVCGRTVDGMVGHVFKTDPVLKIPDALQSIVADIDGGGISLEQQAKKALGDVLAFARCGLLVDYPKTVGPVSKAEQEQGRIRPTVIFYDTFQIINWRTVTVGAKLKLSLLVLEESSVIKDDGFEIKTEKTWRVLKLTDDGVTVERWRKPRPEEKELALENFVLVETPFLIFDGFGKAWDEIPFTFVGVENNDTIPDRPPIYDMAELNIAHYRNSADLEESAFVCGQPTLAMTGLTQDWVDHNLKGKAMFGSRGGLPLPVGGSAELLQADPNSLIKELMEAKEAQMLALGAKLIERETVQKTATQSGIEDSAANSVLSSCAKNVSEAFTLCLKWCQRWLQITDEETSYKLDSTFAEGAMDAQQLAQVMALWQGAAISWTEMRRKLKENGTAFQDDEEAKEEIEAQAPSYGLVNRETEMQLAAKAEAEGATE